MEFLDPRKQRSYMVRLFIGYFLVATALVLTAIILLYHASGFGITRGGKVIQNGLVFVSSKPGGADVYINGQRYKDKTNTRMLLQAGKYNFRVQREGYKPWNRAISIEEGSVVHYDYPFLVPEQLATNSVKTYQTRPLLVTNSPDRRFVFIQNGADFTAFDVYDTQIPDKAPLSYKIPSTIFGLTSGTHSWELVEWANDSSHILLKHITTNEDKKVASEYIVIDREDAAKSFNLTTKLGGTALKITLDDKKFDRYFLFDQANKKLYTATFAAPSPKLALESVEHFKGYGQDKLLYATTQGAPEGKAVVKLEDGNSTYTIRQISVSDTYLLDMAYFDGSWYVLMGSKADDRSYLYKDPQQTLRSDSQAALVPVAVLKVAGATNVEFSSNTRFVMVQSGQSVAVYDAENEKGYQYVLQQTMDTPQTHVKWMDGHRLIFVSGGKTVFCDYDNTNYQTLMATDVTHAMQFDRDYQRVYDVRETDQKDADGKPVYALESTWLLTPADR